jgi:uncharacterized protein (DUF608 family)
VSLSRRSFIAATTAVAGAALSKALATPIAGPFEFLRPDDFPIPADKKFAPEWIASLTARGEPMTFRYKRGTTDADTLDELKYIGMPVGGICTGQVYLGGDGKLWHWDVFNLPAEPTWNDSAGPHYAKPPLQGSPIEQGFAIKIGDGFARRLDRTGFEEITFKGSYPIGEVTFRDSTVPVVVSLEAFSPFCPLDEDDSGLPATIVNYTIKNKDSVPLKVQVAGWLKNPVCLGSMKDAPVGFRKNDAESNEKYSVLACSVNPLPPKAPDPNVRPAILFEDFEKPTYAESMGGWTPTGTAFGDGPLEASKRPSYMGELNVQGVRAVNTHVTSHGEDVGKADTHVGTLTSREFTIERRFISFLIGGGKHPGKECVNLIVDGATVRTATGRNSNKMHIENFDVKEFEGKKARLQIVDDEKGGWGQVWVDDIVFCDEAREPEFVLEEQYDYGTMCVACLGKSRALSKIISKDVANSAFGVGRGREPDPRLIFIPQPIGSVIQEFTLAPGESGTATFVIAWHFANPNRDSLAFLTDIKKLRRHYASRFKDARAVLDYVVENMERLTKTTRLWRDTWYDSTLPYWFLDRTFATACTPATATCYRFETPRGPRFYGWEGTYCCAGTCTHVWNYGQTLARIFPALERNARELVDFDMEFEKNTGLIHYRGEAARSLAIDGQCGTILRAYREHTMCADDAFLRKVWPNVKKAIEFVIARDEDKDGILDGAQYNTLDTTWYGQIAWITSMYLAVLRAGEAMAKEMGDAAFAEQCGQLAESGYKNMPEKLYNGEYFVHVTDPKHPEANSTGNGCHSDMLFGQFYAHQLDLPRLVPAEQAMSAMASLYKYNLAPDVGTYRKFSEKSVKGGRWYAMPGEGGVIVCTWPHGGSDAATGKSGDAWAAMYFNESWTGFEHHVAATMFAEGLVQEGLAVERLIHDRHHGAKRNPYDEIECSSHYARAMSAYGAYIGMCGYAHHGPSGFLAFDPKLTPEKFRCAFTSAGGWGTYSQTREAKSQAASIEGKWGKLRIAKLRLGVPTGAAITRFEAKDARGEVRFAGAERSGELFTMRFERPVEIAAGEKLEVSLGW